MVLIDHYKFLRARSIRKYGVLSHLIQKLQKSDKQKDVKEPNVVDNSANSNDDIVVVPQEPMANDHEASTNKAKPRDPKYTQPKWCPPGLSKAQKRRLQRMRNREKAEQEAKKRRGELSN